MPLASIARLLQHPRRDRPELAAIFRRRVRPHGTVDVAGHRQRHRSRRRPSLLKTPKAKEILEFFRHSEF